MAKVAPIQTNFTGGEFSPLLHGRVDFDKYKNALGTCLNHLPLVQGGITRRPGTMYVAEVKDSSKYTRLVRFEFSVTQAYVLEFGAGYVRFYTNYGQVLDGGTPYEIATPYAEAHIPALSFTQSADTLIIVHPSYRPAQLARSAALSWALSTLSILDGPYMSTNSSVALTPSATSGSITLTAAGVGTINGGSGFLSTDVGRLIRLNQAGDVSAWGFISAYTSSTVVTVAMQTALGTTAATSSFRLGLWSESTGYPACVAFYQDRLCFAGSQSEPTRIDASRTGNYLDFAPTALDVGNTVVDSHALAFSLSSDDVQYIRWLSGDLKGLLVGTASGEWVVSASSLSEALTPTNVAAKQTTAHGSAASVRPVRVSSVTLFLQRSMRKIREMTFVYAQDKYAAPDLCVLAEHATRTGLREVVYQQEPQSIVWAPRNDGVLVGMTYERDQNVIAWHRHVMGGTDSYVDSAACIPAPDTLRNDLWLIVKRTIGGQTVRTVEYMTKIWDEGDDPLTAVYVDCAAIYEGSPATLISGLDYLEGETVTILADGAAHADKTVGLGRITLDRPASTVVVGLPYNSDGQLLRNDAGAADGTSQGKTQRAHRVTFRLKDSLGLKTGRDFDNLVRVIDRRMNSAIGAAVDLFTGDMSETWEGDYSEKDGNLITWRWDQPFPGTILAIMPQQMTQDR